MQYITGLHALNLDCQLNTCGDWHTSAIQWGRPQTKESNEAILGDYGIETNKIIPEHTGTYAVANHIRALLDLIADEKFELAQGMRDEFICTNEYDTEIFDKVLLIIRNSNESRAINIDRFMGSEYKMHWVRYKGSKTWKIGELDIKK